MASTIADFFGGDVAAFQAEDGQLFDGLRLVLDQQFARLSPLEREILVWLAIEHEPVTVVTAAQQFIHPVATAPLLEALQALQNRSLPGKRDGGPLHKMSSLSTAPSISSSRCAGKSLMTR
ncbi:MAG: hypothetical protein R3E79_46830 [Caldilineaceae bacterium]